MRHAVGPRREIGIRTIFNVLGPLTNPAGARHQLLGVFSHHWVRPLAEALGRLGSVHALVVHGEDGLDEISLTAPTVMAEWRNGAVRTATLTPEEFGFVRCTMSDLQVKRAQESAEIIRAVFAGARGPHRDIVLLNAGAALYAGDAVHSIAIGVERARMAIDNGAASRTLERFVALTQTGTV
jgi:anthranilate phosphoribosyltransferase